ncbi:MAG TPA: hypothetical protein VKR60_06965 [Candidatus Sulfotelmatobacter sp.]|nr:hypothetical protein [Candidatus Sulfotelmatobacter sp.]
MTDKWGRRLFAAGAVALILLGLVHSLSLIGKPIAANDTERQLLDLMSNYKFDLMGSMRSMDNFMRGFSINFAIAMVGLGLLDLLLARERAGLLKRLALINSIWLAALLAVSLRYFFIFPTLCLVAGLLIFALAWLKLPAEETR